MIQSIHGNGCSWVMGIAYDPLPRDRVPYSCQCGAAAGVYQSMSHSAAVLQKPAVMRKCEGACRASHAACASTSAA